jgi:hypothetical protein
MSLRQVSASKEHKIASLPAPSGGLNTRDALAVMSISDCPLLVNWIPDTGGLKSRKGYTEWAFGFPGGLPVKSILWYSNNDVIPAGATADPPFQMPGRLFGVTDSAIYEITSPTGVPTVSLVISGTNAGLCSSAMLTNSAGAFMLVCSEGVGYVYYNGTSWTGAPAVTGVATINLVHVNVWKNRAWFVERNSTSVWYLPTSAISGAATEFDFGPLFKRGGYVSFTASWTIDAGEGIDDLFVVVSSNGEVLVYKGTDPASPTTFQLVGNWYIGQVPVGRRGHCQFGGDLILLSADGIFPLSFVTRGGADFLMASAKEYTTKIRPTVGDALRETYTLPGWQMINVSSERLLVVSVPQAPGYIDNQGAMSTSLNAWTVFQGMPVLSMAVVGGFLFFGTPDGRVMTYYGSRDELGFTGQPGREIRTQIQFAYSDFQLPGIEKQVKMLRPYFLSALKPTYFANVSTEYTYLNLPDGPLDAPPIPIGQWDLSQWDAAVWGGSLDVRPTAWAAWRSSTALGVALSAVIYADLIAPTTLTQIDYMYTVGGPL